MSLHRISCFALLAVLAAAPALRAQQEVKAIHDFESEDELKLWQFKHENEYHKDKPAFRPELSDLHVTHGKKSLKLAPNEYLFWNKVLRDWSGYDALELDIFVDGEDPVGGSTLIADELFQKKPSYWNRHNGTFNLKPGANTVSIPVNGLYRGEAGSRNNDIKANIDPRAIIRFDMGFTPKGKVTALYLDHLRLVKESRPEGILAFDFGPESQTLFPGFTGVSWNTVYGEDGRTYGLKRKCSSAIRARDDTFPTRLYQDFVWFQEDGNEFIADVPDGPCHVWLVFDDCGYWGGEAAHFHKRTLSANGKVVYSDDRGADGPADYLFRFENIEPKPGASLWDLYMQDLFKPVRFETTVTGGKLVLRAEADANWSSKVAAIVIYPGAKKAEAEKWIAEVEERNRKEFETRAAFMGPKSQEVAVSDAAKAKGFGLGFPALEQNVALTGAPGPETGALRRAAARGQRVSFTFAVRPLRAFGAWTLSVTDLKGPAGALPASCVDLRYVQHATRRGFNDIAYTIGPESLRKAAGANPGLGQDLTRQFWLTAAVPANAQAGSYAGEVTLAAGELKLALPLTVDVLDVALDEPDFAMGFFGFHVPDDLPPARKATAAKELFTILKENGMNTVSGGPGVPFTGFDADGKPQLDFAKADAFFKLAKECGFTREMHAYGGPGMVGGLHDGYRIGQTGQGWAQKAGKSFEEVLKTVWGAVKEHAEKEGWAPVAYYFCDEPRVLEQAQEEVKLQKAYRAAVPWVKIGGGYSVNWGAAPLDLAIQEYFKTLSFSTLNSHTQTDLDKAKEFGKELYIYNQGTDRYSFGAYQWAEFRKGIKGRIQWHLLALHGYQFFDLDGREPDTAMINWGREEIIPTLHLHRCREGADDFRWAVTLWNLAEKKKGAPEAQAAQAFLEDVNRKIGVGQRKHPDGFMDDEAFRNTCIEHVKKVLAAK